MKKSTPYLIRQQTIDVEEDHVNEFKGHRAFHQNEVNERFTLVDDRGRKLHSRRPISKNFCGMLNTGKGGVIHMGVLDSGRIEGFSMSECQKDHFLINLQHTLRLYTPAVPIHMFSVKFIPVIEEFDILDGDGNTEEPLAELKCDGKETLRAMGEDSWVNKYKRRPHLLASSTFCWCDHDASASFSCGIINPFYVIRLLIHPWNPDNPKNQEFIQVLLSRICEIMSQSEAMFITFHELFDQDRNYPEVMPMFKAEDGVYYMRRNAMNVQLSEMEVDDILGQLKRRVQEIHQQRLNKLPL